MWRCCGCTNDRISASVYINALLIVSVDGFKRISNYKQLLDKVFVISGIIKVEVRVISRSRRLRLITLTETFIIPDITKTESNNCFIIEAILIEAILTSLSAHLTLLSVHLTLLLKIMHYARNRQIIH